MGFSAKCGWWPELLATRIRPLVRDTHGAEIAEAAAVLPLMFMVILGIFWFGQAFSMYGTITRAAQDGARAGATPTCATCGVAGSTPAQNAFIAVQSAMSVARLDPAKARYPSPRPAFNACNGGPVGCDGVSAQVCVQPSVQISSNVGGATGVCGTAVTFQYPFQFKLPFTSLNNQQIWMTASARVRTESQ